MLDRAPIFRVGLLAGCADDCPACLHVDAGDAAAQDSGTADSAPPDAGPAIDPRAGGYGRSVQFDIVCEVAGFAEGPDALLVPVDFLATVATQPTAGDSFEVCFETTATLGQNIADLILQVGAVSGVTSVTLDDLTADGVIAGATSASFLLDGGALPRTVEFDANGDGVGEAVDLDFDTNRMIVASNGTPTVELSLSSLQVTLADVPLINELAINVPSLMGDLATCTFPADASTSTIVLDML